MKYRLIYYIVFVVIWACLIMGLFYQNSTEQPKTKEGEMHYFKPEIERDSVTYDQHPNKKCWHLTNENR